MNTGQTIFALAALSLLLTIVTSMYKTFSNTDKDLMKSEIGITAISLATSLIESAQGKAFDKATDTTDVSSLSVLTDPGSLGRETGELNAADSTFNDFDDFNYYSRVDSFARSGKFYTTARVVYIDPAAPNTASASKTWNKKLTVTVVSPTMQDTIKMDYIFSYWYFR